MEQLEHAEAMFSLIHVADPKIAKAVVEYLSDKHGIPGELRYESQDFRERHSIVGYANLKWIISQGLMKELTHVAKAFADGANWQKRENSFKNKET